tara:strand:- start:660 stop:1037 length:378 start_codon:yes stop_codon:yes gene_type:complete
MNETRSIKWTNGNGNAMQINLTAQFGLDLQANRKTTGLIELSTTTTVDGVSLGGMARLELVTGHPVVAARIANYGIPQAIVDQYNTAKSELESLIKNNNDAAELHVDELDAITEETKRIERRMAY